MFLRINDATKKLSQNWSEPLFIDYAHTKPTVQNFLLGAMVIGCSMQSDFQVSLTTNEL